MHLDLRYPIGLLLTLYGVILAIQGLTADAKVLGLNVNLYWGAAMTVCGLTALYLATVRLKPDPTVRGVKPDPTVGGVPPSGSISRRTSRRSSSPTPGRSRSVARTKS